MGRAPSLLLLLVVGCGDPEPPRWTSGALETEALGAEEVRVRWPQARDDRAVVAYRVRVDDEAARRVAAAAPRELELEAPSPARVHRLRVTAVDAAGNESAPLTAEVRTLDEVPPRFASDAALRVLLGAPGDSGERPVRLRWPPAEDEVGVVEYRVLVDGDEETRTEGREARLLRALDGAEVFEVRAIDAAGNESAGLFSLVPAHPEEQPEPAPREGPSPTAQLVEVTREEGGRELGPVERVLRRRLLSVGGCYRRTLASGPLFDGHVTVALDIRGAGSVREVRLVGAGLGRPSLVRCMRSVLRRAAFPEGGDGTFRARYEFAL